jgi:8-oxo-dGTP pyrophosphatase MutT (NUDIX family)
MKRIPVYAKAVLVNKTGDILLLRRSQDDKNRPGEWDFSGGSVDDNEDFTAAVAREIEEEIGQVLGHQNLHLVHVQAGRRSSGENVCYLNFIGFTDKSDIRLSHEHEEYVWVTLEKALQVHKHPRHLEILRFIQSNQLLAS